MRTTTVTFLSPGTFVDEQTTKDIPSRDPQLALKLAGEIIERHGAKPYGFYFSTVLVAAPVPDGEGGTLNVEPREIEKSGTYFIGGKLMTFDEVEQRADPRDRILLDNMRFNEFKIVIQNDNSWRTVKPFEESDFIVDRSGWIAHRGDEPELVEYRKRKIAEHKAEREAEMAKWRAETK